MIEHHSVDQALISKLTEIVLANMTDGNFNVEKLAKEAGISAYYTLPQGSVH